MSFFNKKEDVLSLELTPYGRHLLSVGKLKPKYYCFFDDDVIYDAQSAGITENSSGIKNRILTNTPSLRPPINFETDEKTISQNESYLKLENIKFPSTNDKIYFLNKPIGTSDYNADTSCAFRATFLQNTISSSSNFIQNISGGVQQIPQINTNFTYNIQIKDLNNETSKVNTTYLKPEIRSDVFADGTYFDITPDKMIVQLLEENNINSVDNFEIEVYKVDDNDSTKMRQLKFSPSNTNIKDNMIIDVVDQEGVDINEDYVEYYFDIFIDDEISPFEICEGISVLKSKDVFIDLEIKCDDFELQEQQRTNIYSSRVSNTDIEACD